MTQVMRIMDGYGYPAMIWTVFIMLARGQAQGRMPLPEGLAQSRLVLRTLDRLMPAAAEFLAGDALTLADTHTLPMLVYFAQTAPGRAMLREFPRLDAWLAGMRARSEEHTSELQSLMRISYAVFCLKNKKNK